MSHYNVTGSGACTNELIEATTQVRWNILGCLIYLLED